MAQCRRRLLRQTDPPKAQARRLPFRRRSPGRHQPLHQRIQCQPTQAIHLEGKTRRHYRRSKSRVPNVGVNPLARRLLERNSTIGAYREKIRVFLISSGEAVGVARIIQDALSRDFLVVPWTDGVFKIANYALQSLEDELEKCDFAIAVAHTDDVTLSRGQDWPSPRDNVIFELGLFMGRLSRQRAILMEPREEKVKLPSDLAGVTTIPYRYVAGEDAVALMGPACNALRNHINRLGPFNG